MNLTDTNQLTYRAPEPRSRRQRVIDWTVAILISAIVTTILGLVTGVIHTYDGQNDGITVGVGCHGLGFEYRGHTGFFTDLCE